MALEVIGAGLGRTGTESLKRALETLGYGPCYHMYEVLPHPDRVDTWRSLLAGKSAPDWNAIFAGFRATVDWPGAHYWRELAAYYPDAKIILSVRSPASWYASMNKTILSVMRKEANPISIAYQIGQVALGGEYNDRDHVEQVFVRHNEAVQAEFGKDRLLTYELGSGWEPLCAFLGCEVPPVPYPSGNQTEEFHSRVTSGEAERNSKRASRD